MSAALIYLDSPCFLFAVLPLQLRAQTQMTAERRGRVTVSEEAAEAALLSSRVEDLLEAVSRRSAVACKRRGCSLGSLPRGCQGREFPAVGNYFVPLSGNQPFRR